MLSVEDILQPENVSYTDNVWTWAVAHMLHKGEDWQITTITDTAPIEIVFLSKGEPLTDYIISGNTLQNGTPTPEAPVDVQGFGEMTGNLYDMYATDTSNGFVDDAYLSNTGVARESGTYFVSEYIPTQPNTEYTLVYAEIAANNPSVCFYDSSKSFISGESYSAQNPVTFTTPNETAFIRFSGYDNNKSIIMLNLGSEALPYEPYGYKLPLTVNGTEHPIYLGQVPTTRQIKKLVLTGTEVINTLTVLDQLLFQFAGAYTNDKIYGNALDTLLCNGYKIVNGRTTAASDENNYSMTTYNSTNDNRLIVHDDRFTTVDDFKSYLASQYAAGTPVTIWYVLATPETAIVNEPLMKIGDYADTISMAQASVTIPTTAGTNTLTVGTTVQPSSMSITGKIREAADV